MKIISFCLYGDRTGYTLGMIENCILAKQLFPEWMVSIHYNDTVPLEIISDLKSRDNVKLYHMSGDDMLAKNTMWRFKQMTETNDTIICRDADSRLTERDVDTVNRWLATDFDFQISRDSVSHRFPVMAGAFGVRNGIMKPFAELLSNYMQCDKGWYVDQLFMAEVYRILPKKAVLAFSVRCHRDRRCGFSNENRVLYVGPNKERCIGYICFELITPEMIISHGKDRLRRIDNPRQRIY